MLLNMKSISDTTRRANIPHQCKLCGRQINPGDEYVRRVGVVAGAGRKTLHVHKPCLDYTVADNWDDLDWATNDQAVFLAIVSNGGAG